MPIESHMPIVIHVIGRDCASRLSPRTSIHAVDADFTVFLLISP